MTPANFLASVLARLSRGSSSPVATACAAAFAIPAFAPALALASLIATGDGTGNTTPPTSDPGFGRIGIVNGLSGVYARNGWVLTASHVGIGPFWLNGVTYQPVPGSLVRFDNPNATLADLVAFKLTTRPPLADIAITDSAPTVNTLVTVIGYGADRGPSTSWMGVNGWTWSGARSMRWGTNRIASVGDFALDTQSFRIVFDDIPNPPQGQHEADIVFGDSGGGAFTGSGTSAELVGILFAHAAFVGQPANTSLFGNAGLIADLFAYRSDILATVDRPDCNDGLDEDGDGLVDFPADPGCAGASDTSERSSAIVCDNGNDDDADGAIDFPADPGCSGAPDASERDTTFQCENGFDDDGDLLVDSPNAPGCLHPTNPIEAPEPAASWLLASGVVALAASLPLRRQTSSTRSTR